MNKTFSPPPPGSYRLPTWVKALLIVFFVSAVSWIVLCVIAVTWTNEEMTNYDFVAKPAQKSPRQAIQPTIGNADGSSEPGRLKNPRIRLTHNPESGKVDSPPRIG